jgi:hypothetical protein
MRNLKGKIAILLVFAFTTLLMSAQGLDEKKKKPEAYSGVAIGTGGSVGGRSIQFDLRITRYTSDEELNNFATLVKEKGTDALRRALEKENVGRINPTGHVGNDVAIARKRQVGNKTIITIVTARVMSFTELYRSNRSVDYPFGYMQITLNEDGKSDGMGQIMAAAKIRFNKKSGQYEIESYGNQYIKATNVMTWK